MERHSVGSGVMGVGVLGAAMRGVWPSPQGAVVDGGVWSGTGHAERGRLCTTTPDWQNCIPNPPYMPMHDNPSHRQMALPLPASCATPRPRPAPSHPRSPAPRPHTPPHLPPTLLHPSPALPPPSRSSEAQHDASSEPLLSSFLYASILAHDSFELSLAFVLANRLANSTMLPTQVGWVCALVLCSVL